MIMSKIIINKMCLPEGTSIAKSQMPAWIEGRLDGMEGTVYLFLFKQAKQPSLLYFSGNLKKENVVNLSLK